mgnify:FL=1|jgi:hypothetical protein
MGIPHCLAAFIHWPMNRVSRLMAREVEGLEPFATPVVIRSCRPEKGPMFRLIASAHIATPEQR